MWNFDNPLRSFGLPACALGLLGACSSPSADVISALPVSTLSYLETDSTVVVADGNDAKLIRAFARDADGHPLVDYAVAFFSDDATVTFTQPQPTNAQGIATGLIRSTTPGDKWVQGLLANQTSAQAFGHGIRISFVENIDASSSPNTPAATTSMYFYSNSVNTTADGNDVLTLSVAGRLRPGQVINVTSSNPNDVLVPATGTLNTSGLFQTTLRSTSAGSRTFRATAGALQRSVKAALYPGAPDANHCTTTLSPNMAVANGMDAASLFATIADKFNNTIAYETVTATADNPNVQFGSNAGMTDDTGVFSVDIRSTAALTPNIALAVGDAPSTVSLTARPIFVAGPASSLRSTLYATATNILLSQSTNVSLQLSDAQGNPVGNQNVSFHAGAPNDAFAPALAVTDPNGLAQSVFTPAVAGTRRVSAGTDSAHAKTDVTVRPTNSNAQFSSLIASPNVVRADGVANSNIVLTVLDANQAAVSSVAVNFVALDGNVVLTSSSGHTDAQGVLRTSASSAFPASTVVEAQWPDATMAVDLFFVTDPNS